MIKRAFALLLPLLFVSPAGSGQRLHGDSNFSSLYSVWEISGNTMKDERNRYNGSLAGGAAFTVGRNGPNLTMDKVNGRVNLGASTYQMNFPFSIIALVETTDQNPTNDFGSFFATDGIRLGFYYNSSLQLCLRHYSVGGDQTCTDGAVVRLNDLQLFGVIGDGSRLDLYEGTGVVKTAYFAGSPAFTAGDSGIGSPNGTNYRCDGCKIYTVGIATWALTSNEYLKIHDQLMRAYVQGD